MIVFLVILACLVYVLLGLASYYLEAWRIGRAGDEFELVVFLFAWPLFVLFLALLPFAWVWNRFVVNRLMRIHKKIIDRITTPLLLILALVLCGCSENLSNQTDTQALYNARLEKRVKAGEPPPVATPPVVAPESLSVGDKVKVKGMTGIGVVKAFRYHDCFDVIFESHTSEISFFNGETIHRKVVELSSVPAQLLEKTP